MALAAARTDMKPPWTGVSGELPAGRMNEPLLWARQYRIDPEGTVPECSWE